MTIRLALLALASASTLIAGDMVTRKSAVDPMRQSTSALFKMVSSGRLSQRHSSLSSELASAVEDATEQDSEADHSTPPREAAPNYEAVKEQMAKMAEGAEDVRRRDAESRMQNYTAQIASQGAGSVRGRGCRSRYDLTRLHLQTYQDGQLEAVAGALRRADLGQAISKAKDMGYDQAAARNAALGQAQEARASAAQSERSAQSLISGSSGIDRYRTSGLPSDFQCGGAGAAAVCAYFIASWTVEVSEQTADGIECLW